MVPWQQGGFAQLLDRDLRRGHVRVPEAEIDHVLAGAPELELEPLDLGKGIRRQGVYAPELHGRKLDGSLGMCVFGQTGKPGLTGGPEPGKL